MRVGRVMSNMGRVRVSLKRAYGDSCWDISSPERQRTVKTQEQRRVRRTKKPIDIHSDRCWIVLSQCWRGRIAVPLPPHAPIPMHSLRMTDCGWTRLRDNIFYPTRSARFADWQNAGHWFSPSPSFQPSLSALQQLTVCLLTTWHSSVASSLIDITTRPL